MIRNQMLAQMVKLKLHLDNQLLILTKHNKLLEEQAQLQVK